VSQRSPARKALTVLRALAVAGVVLWFGSRVVLISGTKANGTFSTVAPRPPAAAATTPTATTATKAAPAPEKSP
jgi:hypothetical protein